ncbi:competence type IV pilus major pilin ComGC [Neobacillus mesonae]|uniref:ComG operon protein 3 n=1 Tax=Neobacillus mesonae TaxID=1193713 RepID=A0A3T0I1U6_9BACI|nr:competence type IV pilus major pilin ComGC [Neobacillus mesonae]AZU63325.1 competence protein ComG [Neobacillus mesonae]MED4204401.1 competence type IV pilus major pilin ComGC [Neobacillus mesonae]
MKKKMVNSEKGFTLIEMMIVMLIISVLLIITIPNVTKHNSNINEKGCQAYVKMVQAEVQAYQVDKNKIPTLTELKSEGYIKDDKQGCPNGKAVEINASTGEVTVAQSTES